MFTYFLIAFRPHQHQCEVSIQKGIHSPYSAPDLLVQPLYGIAGLDLDPMFRRKVTLAQDFLDPTIYLLCRLFALLGMNCLEHFRHILHLGFEEIGEYVPMK